jgi:hypothetical protein
MSLALPALNGLITCTDRVGQLSAMTGEVRAQRATPTKAPHNVRIDVIDSSLEW